jgi:hypothetical protein
MLKLSYSGFAMAVVHLAILGYSVAHIVAASTTDWPLYWTIFLALDFPVSLAVVPLAWISPASPAGPLSDFANFWWPLGIHGLFGTLWWYIVGSSIGDRLSRLRARAGKDNHST